eukprot:TRINITY_DN3591_c0_g1_i1.p1 TRINITY_DN3591_c0_g1~~TRINITY_DN3591_c0_g1_i1.p1  ORF type:complete len:193 (+),score=54.37 TRINITY_DN3591_c0_g1_i1:54-632(+)
MDCLIEGRVWTLRELLSADECRTIIEDQTEDMSVKFYPPTRESTGRLCMRRVFDDEELARRIEDRLPGVRPEIGGWRYVGVHKSFTIVRYEPEHFFGLHTDHRSDVDRRRRTQLTLMIYMNDDFEGGDTRFATDPEIRIRPETGLALMFVQGTEARLPHEGCPITAGQKHILRTSLVFERVGDDPGSDDDSN